MPTPELPPVRPDLDILFDTALRTAGETDRFDFKEVLDLATDEHRVRLVRAVGAFSNTDEGGFVLIGIADDRRVVGLDEALAAAFDQTRVHAICAQYLAPPPSIQVRQHQYKGQRVVVIEVSSFVEVPSVVRQSATFGKERLFAGTFLFRSKAAKSGVLEAESDVRALCDVLVKRRASTFLELLQRGDVGRVLETSPNQFTAIEQIRPRFEQLWPTTGGNRPSIEVGFTPAVALSLTPEQLRQIIPGACVPTKHGFPFWDLNGAEVHRPVAWGWYGRIPFAALDVDKPEPTYLWVLSRAGAFIHRERLWEDSQGSVIPGGVGLFHVAGNAILGVRFLGSVATKLGLDGALRFRLRLAATDVLGRYLENERNGWMSPLRKKAAEAVVAAEVDVTLSDVRRRPREIAAHLVEEIAWQFGRDDLRRHDVEEVIQRAPDHLGDGYALPATDGAGSAPA